MDTAIPLPATGNLTHQDYWMGARTYNALQSRFRQTDPLPGQDTLADTAYSYAANDPVNNIDPDGRKTRKVTIEKKFDDRDFFPKPIRDLCHCFREGGPFRIAKITYSVKWKYKDGKIIGKPTKTAKKEKASWDGWKYGAGGATIKVDRSGSTDLVTVNANYHVYNNIICPAVRAATITYNALPNTVDFPVVSGEHTNIFMGGTITGNGNGIYTGESSTNSFSNASGGCVAALYEHPAKVTVKDS